jgi:hypothetical protein
MENYICYISTDTKLQHQGYHTSCFLRALRPKHFRRDGSFKFVEMSGFLTICYSLNILHIFMLMKLQKKIYIFILRLT